MVLEKTVLITGCSSGGLGSALATAFREQGFHVFATARNPAKVGALAGEDGIEVLPLDVTSAESIASCMAQVRKRTDGRLDVLVNNAGSVAFGPLVHAPVAKGKAIYDVNVWGPLAVVQAFTPLLMDAGGVILNISSIAGAVPLAWQGRFPPPPLSTPSLSTVLRQHQCSPMYMLHT
jgi:NAD(P)-dependent dehydrogenase (short-subunit alcohol dehydrogenase family)